MEELFRKFLSGAVDSVVQAGVASLVTDVDFKDALKVTAGTNALNSVLGGGSPLDLFNNKNQAAGSPAGGPTAVLNAPVNNSSLSQVQQAQRALGTGQGQAGQKQGGLTALAGQVNPNAFNLGTNNAGGVSNSSLTPVVAPADTRGIMESFGDVISGDGGRMNALKQLFLPDAAGDPDPLRKYGPAFLAAIAAGKGLGAFDEAEVDQSQSQPFGGLTGGGLLAQNPGRYSPGVPSRGYAQGGGISNLEAFPRRNGGISGPGTPTSDDIPAMLSDGEFVMTEAAVRGMGNGNRQRGIQNMYQVMDNLESRVA
jgi:hypothetical protein|tara:strand:+ start:131 stop:1063 length:933 start_codon:yes stop_codon:yes gene_type:complete